MARALNYERAKARQRAAEGRDLDREESLRTRKVQRVEREWRRDEFGTPITTKYDGTCAGCGEPIRAGKRAHYSKVRGLLHVGRGCRYPDATSTAGKA